MAGPSALKRRWARCHGGACAWRLALLLLTAVAWLILHPHYSTRETKQPIHAPTSVAGVAHGVPNLRAHMPKLPVTGAKSNTDGQVALQRARWLEASSKQGGIGAAESDSSVNGADSLPDALAADAAQQPRVSLTKAQLLLLNKFGGVGERKGQHTGASADEAAAVVASLQDESHSMQSPSLGGEVEDSAAAGTGSDGLGQVEPAPDHPAVALDPSPSQGLRERVLALSDELGGAGHASSQTLEARERPDAARVVADFTADTLISVNETVLERERTSFIDGSDQRIVNLVGKLISCAEYALTQGPWSVVDKTELPSSGNKHDYYTPKPYYWPNPDSESGLPYVRMDGRRVPGTDLYDEESDKFDRTRLAAMVGNTSCLGLAHYFTGDQRYAEKAAENIRAWFMNPETSMTPTCKYAQILWGTNNNKGDNTGVIEFKDFYFLLDAVRIVHRSGAFHDADMDGLRSWFREYRTWLTTSRQGHDEFMSNNNHGLYYDVQIAAIHAFLGDTERFVDQMDHAQGRMLAQFDKDGSLPHEMFRKTQLHYIMFTLMGWYTLSGMAAKAGVDFWRFRRPGDSVPILKRAAIYAVPYFSGAWQHFQEDEVDMDRMLPLYYVALAHYPDLISRSQYGGNEPPPPFYDVKPLFYEHDGIRPFWNLGLTDCYL